MAEESTTYTGNGQYVLTRLAIVTTDENTGEDQELDLRAVFVDCTLYESVWSQMMSGAVSVIDSFNLKDLLPLYGDETIEIEFYTSGNEKNPISFSGRISKIDPENRITEHSSGYSIHFVSSIGIISERSFVQQGFNTTGDQAVTAIFNSHFKNASNKLLETSSSVGVIPYSFGAITPLEAISLVSRSAKSSTGGVGYLFYEHSQGFAWKTITDLYQQQPVTEFYYRTAGVYENVKQRNVESFNAIQDYQVLTEPSFLDRIRDGQHGSTYNYLDLIGKKMVKKTFDIDGYFQTTDSLGTAPSRRLLTNSGYTDKWVLQYATGNIEAIGDRHLAHMKRACAGKHSIRILTFGDSAIKAGDLCYGRLPNWNQDQQEVKTAIDGKFLISDIKHSLSTKDYYQTILLQKDAFDDNG